MSKKCRLFRCIENVTITAYIKQRLAAAVLVFNEPFSLELRGLLAAKGAVIFGY